MAAADAQEISAVVFDLGGVLLDWDPRYLYRQLIGDPAKLDHFLDRICSRDWHRAHDLGVDTGQSCRELASLHPGYAELIMAWSERGEEMIAGVFEDSAAVLAELKAAGLPCFALSNMEADRYEQRRARFSFFELFDGCVISGIEGVMKPDRKIFDVLLARYGLEPAGTAFIDDQPANVMAARELGVVAIEFTSSAQLRLDLRELGLPVAAP
ncbi:MAG TPA: HAD family phosphatase [Streptosporangiaceae bacterium]|nr:HAD family phosphatase [Streptosporangiaceae bacterium]